MLFSVNVAFGQTDSTKVSKHYCMMFCKLGSMQNLISKMGSADYDDDNVLRIEVYLDFGEYFLGYGIANEGCSPVSDKDGSLLTFKSPAAALEWMSERGWKPESFQMSVNNTMVSFLLSKNTTKQKIKEGITTQIDYRKSER